MRSISFTPIMAEANFLKTTKGHESRRKLASILYGHYQDGRLKSLVENYRVGKPGFANSEQFFAAFMLHFQDGCRWIIYNTTSLRDRVKEQLWDAANIKAIDSTVERAYLTYPLVSDGGSAKEILKFCKKNRQFEEKKEYSSLDGIIGWDRLDYLIREKSDEYYRQMYDDAQSPTKLGRKYDFVGRSFERDVAAMLSDKDNLAKFNGKIGNGGVQYQHFKTIVEKFGIKPGEACLIRATANHRDIGDLPSGGSPKTDVIVGVVSKGQSERYYTVSCKCVAKSSEVSAHQYSADTFADVLDRENQNLRDALKCFQTAGSFKGMSEEATAMLEKEIAPYIEPLCRWVVGGYGGAGEEKHMAQYLVTYRTSDNAFAIHSTEEYVRMLLSRKSTKKLGTPFGWTMASGERGKSIQLKMPIIF